MWRPFGVCMLLFGIIRLLGLMPSGDSPGMYFVVPIVVCATVLYFTYRRVTSAMDE